MTGIPNRFPRNDIISLTESAPLYDLAESVGPDLRLRDLLGEADLAALQDLPLGYGTAAGDLELRKALALLHGVAAEDVVITVGGMQALFLTAFILCAPGDEAVIVSPVFPNALTALSTVGATVRTVQLAFDKSYRLTPDDVRSQLTPRTKLVSLASPQNPSGVFTPLETLQRILAIMADICPQAFLLVDETYREAVYGRDVISPSAIALSSRIISTASLSKCHGVPGLRLGWAITRDPALREQLMLGKFNSVISCSTLDETLALHVLQKREQIIGERRKHFGDGLARVAAWIESQGGLVDWVRPDAGALCCVRLNPAAFDAGAVNRFYDGLHREGVRVAPGTWFGDEPRIFRLGFGLLAMSDLEAGLRGLSSALSVARKPAA